jgi:hypothetical protein
MLASMSRLMRLILGCAAVFAVIVPASGPSVTATSRPDSALHRCKPGSRHAVIARKHECLRPGRRCRKNYDRQYHRYRFHCHSGRLTRSRPVPPPPPASPPAKVGTALPAALATSTGTTFSVAPGGSDANPGTAAAPWRTIQKALNTLQPGQRALVRAGTYAESLRFDRAGTATAPITVEGYPGERPVLTSVGGRPLEIGSRAAYFRFDGFVVEKSPFVSGGNIDVYGRNIELSDNEVRLSRDQGIYTAEGSRNVQILRNSIHSNGQGVIHQSHGIYLQGNDHLVANNVIHDHPHGFGIQVYDRNSRSIITGNTVTNSGHSAIVLGGSAGVDSILVLNNIFAFNRKFGIQHDSSCPTRSRAHHNVLYGNGSGAAEPGCAGLDYAGGNRTGDPRFRDYAARDLHLGPGSPALNYAVAEYSPTSDHDGRLRPQGPAADAGAYEG